VLRGIKTLHLRMQAHSANAMQVARYLETNVRVRAVLYPELESHPQHAIHRRQTTGMSGMMSFYLRGGIDESRTFLAALKVSRVEIYCMTWMEIAEHEKIVAEILGV
jgi:cystathionine gamma-lyase